MSTTRETQELLPTLLLRYRDLVDQKIVNNRTTLKRWMSRPKDQDPFPSPLRLSENSLAWRPIRRGGLAGPARGCEVIVSNRAITWAIGLQLRPPALKLVLFTLANRADREGTCWPSISKIASDTSLSRSTVVVQLQRLEDLRLIEREHGRGKTLTTRLLMDSTIPRIGLATSPNVGQVTSPGIGQLDQLVQESDPTSPILDTLVRGSDQTIPRIGPPSEPTRTLIETKGNPKTPSAFSSTNGNRKEEEKRPWYEGPEKEVPDLIPWIPPNDDEEREARKREFREMLEAATNKRGMP